MGVTWTDTVHFAVHQLILTDRHAPRIFQRGKGADSEAMYNLCFILKLCYKAHITSANIA
jgi:hypothetical protein